MIKKYLDSGLIVRRYQPSDVDYAEHLLDSRNMSVDCIKDLPANGLICTLNYIPIAMGFIRLIEGNYGQIDSLITGSYADPKTRNEALDVLVTNLIELAKSLNIKKLVSYTEDNNTLVWSDKFGFVRSAHAVIALDLTVKGA